MSAVIGSEGSGILVAAAAVGLRLAAAHPRDRGLPARGALDGGAVLAEVAVVLAWVVAFVVVGSVTLRRRTA